MPQAAGGYRPDIEGMRALAILLVIAAHAELPGLEAGFIGVDIFFVISGYLISGLLVAEHARSDRIDIAAFYARRFRRLLPALLMMLFVTAIAVRLLLPPQEQAYHAFTGAAASVWLSNLYFALESIDYFGLESESNAYLHTWSLGVEEQFYLVWPLVMGFFLFRAKRFNSSVLAWGMVTILAVSLVACIWTTLVSARHAFYLMPLRAWQFAAGALAYLLGEHLARVDGQSRDRKPLEALGVVGVMLLGGALALIRKDAAYPGGWAVLPTLGTICLLVAGRVRSTLATRVLSLRPMQALGKVSYSWYLWHWPILVLGAVLLPTSGFMGRISLVIVGLLMAFLSYRLVERPIRENGALIRKPHNLVLASLLLMLASLALFMRWGDALRVNSETRRAPSGMEPRIDAGSMPVIYAMGCDDWYRSDRLSPCIFGPASAPRTAVVVGDSIGLQWFPAYAKVFASPEWRLIVLTKSSCPMVDSPIFNPRIGREFTECERWRNKALDYIAGVRPDIVIMGTTHAAGFPQDTWVSGTDRVLSRVAPFSDSVRIIRSTPILPFNGPRCLWLHRESGEDVADEACSALSADPVNEDVTSWIRQAAGNWANVDVIDMNGDVCPGGVCRAERDGMPVFRDTQHLTAEYVERLSDRLKEELGDALESSDE